MRRLHIGIAFFSGILLFLFFFSQLYFLHQPQLDFDEGVYTTTFALIQKGYSAYSQTFLSQPPGFLFAVYPGFVMFGQTLLAARTTMLLWNICGLLAVVWLFSELRKPGASLLAIGLLLLTPVFVSHLFIVQSDMLVSVFTLLAFASMYRFLNTRHVQWLLFTSFFITFAFWTKYSFYILIPFGYILVKQQIKLFLIFLLPIFLISLYFLLFFNFPALVQQTITLHLTAYATGGKSLFMYVQEYPLIVICLLLSIMLFILEKKKFAITSFPLFLWAASIFLVYIFYHPLFEHHLTIIFTPLIIVFSALIWEIHRYKRVLLVGSLLVFFLGIVAAMHRQMPAPLKIANRQEQKEVAIITKETSLTDTILTDDEMLYSLSNRYPLPQFSDISFVRIQTDNATAPTLAKLLAKNPPKLILPVTGRLVTIKGFQKILQSYTRYTHDHIVYYLKK